MCRSYRATLWNNRKLRRITIIGILIMGYALAEIGFSVYIGSLVMFADGLHNASDGLALAVAFWAEKVVSHWCAPLACYTRLLSICSDMYIPVTPSMTVESKLHIREDLI